MKDWLFLNGNFKEDNGDLSFLGKEKSWQDVNTGDNKNTSEFGIALYATKYINGKITAEVEFKNIKKDFTYSCYFIFNYSNINNINKHFNVGISKTVDALSTIIYQEYTGQEYINVKGYGTSLNIVQDEKYIMEMELIGSTFTFKLNNFVIFKNDIKIDSPSNQIGLLFQSTDAIIIHKFTVENVSRKAFVVMQFEKDFDDLYKGVIEPVCKEYGYEVIRADESFSTGIIIQDIIKLINESSIIIADITPDNPNVFYEVGYSHALKKSTILLNEKNKREKLPFDISSFRTIFYDNSIGGKTEIENRLKMFLENINDNIQ